MTLRSDIVAHIAATVPQAGTVYADRAVNQPDFPHVVVTMDTNRSPMLTGDARVVAWRHSYSVYLFQESANEDDSLGELLSDALDGWKPASALRLHIESSARNLDPAFDLVYREFVVVAVVVE